MNPSVVLGFDMETDIGSWTPFYEGLVHGTPGLLKVLGKHGAKATFLFTGDSVRTNPGIVKMVDGAGHEVGSHSLYHETMGDEIFPIPGVKPLLPEECHRRLSVSTEIVEDVLGRKITSFRAPRLWGSTAMVNALEDLGYTADLSYPMYYYEDRLSPYHPSRENWTVEGTMGILEIPNFADMTIESADSYGRDRDQWPLFRTEGADAVMVHVDNMLNLYREKETQPVLCFYMHPWEFHEMPEGLIHFGEGAVFPDPFITKNCGKVALDQLDLLLSALEDRGAGFTTAQELTSRY